MSTPAHVHLLTPFPTLTTSATATTTATATDDENLRPLTSSSSRTSIETWIHTTQAAQLPAPLTSTSNPLKRKRTSYSTASQQSDSSHTVQTSNKEPACQPGSSIELSIASMPDDALAFQQAPTPSSTVPESNPPSTPRTEKSTGKFKLGKDPGFIGRRMTQHGLHINSEALKKYPAFEATVRGIIRSDRHSGMRPQSADNITSQRQYYAHRNEDTILHRLIPLIIKEHYLAEVIAQTTGSLTEALSHASSADGLEEGGLEEGKKYVSGYWFADGVDVAVNEEFRKTFLPNKVDEDEFGAELVTALKKEDGMTNPKPDYCYGIRHDKFPVPSDVVIDTDLATIMEVAPGQNNSFFVIEGKSNRGSHTDAENQARRDGATLINAARMLYDRIGATDVMGADERTFVYSATMTPEFIAIWVHWAEVTKEGTLFHMNRLTQKLLSEAEALVELRTIFHNILEWGCIGRFAQLEEFHKSLHTWQRGETAKRKVGEGDPSRKRRRERK